MSQMVKGPRADPKPWVFATEDEMVTVDGAPNGQGGVVIETGLHYDFVRGVGWVPSTTPGADGTDGAAGSNGTNGTNGSDGNNGGGATAVTYTYDSTTTAADPGSGKFRISSDEKKIYIDDLAANGSSYDTVWDALEGDKKAFIYIKELHNDAVWKTFVFKKAVAQTGYHEWRVKKKHVGGSFTNGGSYVITWSTAGANTYSSGSPADDTVGDPGDLFHDTSTGDVYEKGEDDLWPDTAFANLKGADGESGVTGYQWQAGSGAPSTGDSQGDGAWYHRTSNDRVYKKSYSFGSLTFTNKLAETGTTTSTSTKASTGTWTPTNGRGWLLAAQIDGVTSSTPTITSASGNGIDWQLLQMVQFDTHALAVFYGQESSGTSNGATTINFSTLTGTSRYHIHVDEITGMDTTGTNGSAMVVQSGYNRITTGGVTDVGLGITLNELSASTAAYNAVWAATGHSTAEATTPHSGWSELSDANGSSPAGGMETQYKIAPTALSNIHSGAPSATWATNSYAAIIALEILAAQTSATYTPLAHITATAYHASPSDPTGTTSSSQKMMGLAGSFTPAGTQMLVLVSGTIEGNSSGKTGTYQLRYGTGSAPTNGAAATGTTVGAAKQVVTTGNGQPQQFIVHGCITGLTSGTAYWLDIGLASNDGATTFTVKKGDITATDISS